MSREELEAARKAELEKKAKERETPEWAAGLRQQREAAERRAAMAAEAAKPFARSKCAMVHPVPADCCSRADDCNHPVSALSLWIYSQSTLGTLQAAAGSPRLIASQRLGRILR